MFEAVADWMGSGQSKQEFLKNKKFGKPKFNYWIRKFKAQRQEARVSNEFKEIEIPDSGRLDTLSTAKKETSQKIVITTPSGFVVTVVEQC